MESSHRLAGTGLTIAVALIGAAALVGAAWAGGYWASWGAKEAIRAENERNAARLEAEARGAARILASEFFLAAKEMSNFAVEGYFRPFDDSYRVEISQDDLQLVASRLSREQWTEIYLAMSSVQGLERYVRLRSRPDHPMSKQPLPLHTLELVSSDMEYLGRAVAALSGLGELENAGFPTLDPEAAYQLIQAGIQSGRAG